MARTALLLIFLFLYMIINPLIQLIHTGPGPNCDRVIGRTIKHGYMTTEKTVTGEVIHYCKTDTRSDVNGKN